MLSSLADRLKMPMSGAAQGGKKTVDDELDDQFGDSDSDDDSEKGDTNSDKSEKQSTFSAKTPLGKATVAELKAALAAKTGTKGDEKTTAKGKQQAQEDEDESGSDEDSDDDDDKATY